ncbi:hypothetical protein [Roseateles paludis]|jgi:hypothetical protein|uniref:Uncharacterized protein n=1 Tax=Roseateles paludis TaxID=3145238 RepID=A0ABV0FVX6_9BURK
MKARPDVALSNSTRRWLQTHRWMRLHVLLLALCCLAVLWGTAVGLRLWGVDSLALRYGVSTAVGYGVYLLLLRLWAAWLLRREADLASEVGNGFDALELGVDVGLDVAQGLAGGLDGLGSAVGAAAEAEEAALVLVPLAVVVTVVLGLAFLLGTGVLALFGVEVLLGVSVEVALASAAAGLAWRHQRDFSRQGWLACALSHTWPGALALCVAGVLMGVALDNWVPEAQSLPDAVRLLRVR